MKRIITLGAGLVGKAVAIDLSRKYDVTTADVDSEALQFLSQNHNIKTVELDATDKINLLNCIKDFDIVISAVPGSIGFEIMKNVIEYGVDLVDISFMPEDALALGALAKEKGVTVITDCGVAPGLPNFIIGYHNEIMKIERAEYYVGGLPKERIFPFEYKAPFSPADVIEEYTRPARFIENGKIATRPAMTDAELIDFPCAGKLEAFNTDGLRSLIQTMKNIPNLKEKTLRYPGHINYIRALMEAGFFSREPVAVNGKQFIPFEVTTKILFDNWKLNPGDEEFTVLRAKLIGEENGVRKEITYDLYDEYDNETGFSSMARTTGFTACAAADMILTGKFNQKGVFPPELVGKDKKCFEHVMGYLKERNVELRKDEIERK